MSNMNVNIINNVANSTNDINVAKLTNSTPGIKMGWQWGNNNNNGIGANDLHGFLVTCPLSCTITHISWVSRGFTRGNKIVMGVYANSGALPGALLVQTAEHTLSDVDYTVSIVLPLASPLAITQDTEYWLSIHSNATIYGDLVNNYGTVNRKYRNITWNATMPDPFGTPTGTAGNVAAMCVY